MKLLVIFILYSLILAATACGQIRTVNVSIDYEKVLAVSAYRAGVTHTQYSIDEWGNSSAIENARLLLDSVSYFQNQHIMGWGTLSPWPDSTVINPENWEWETLDTRINLIRETNGVPVITLCGAPTWMHDPSKNGQTDWDALEANPTPDHYDDFAHLCAEVARRYPDVLYYQVWNEFKGFYLASENRWDYENYTKMYNMVYDSLKKVNPNLLIGGPYVVMDSWSTSAISHPSDVSGVYGTLDQRPLDVINYWLQNKKGADFITIDGGNDSNRDGVWITDGFRASQKFTDVINWIRQQPGGEILPVWWAEWYAYPGNIGSQGNQNLLNAVMAAGMIKSILAGYSNLMIWQPQGDAQGFSFPLGIWTNTEISGGGQPTFYYYTQKGLKDYFSDGTEIYKSSSSPEDVISVFATDTTILLVNQLNEQVEVNIPGLSEQIILNPYEVRFLIGVDLMTSIENKIKSTNFSVFPNPFTDQLNISFYQIDGGYIKIEFYNINGTKIFDKDYDCLPGQNKLILVNTGKLTSGPYLIHVSNNRNSFKQLLIKN